MFTTGLSFILENFKTCFFSALSHRLSKLEDLCTIRSQLVDYIAELLKLESKSGSLRTTFSDTDYDTWKKTRTLVNKLSPKNQKHSYKIVFYALFLELALQMFNDRSVATSSLTELFLCYKNVKQGKKTETDDPEWIDVVVDVFLNLLSQNSSVLRNIIKSVFPLLCKYMTPYNVHQILSTLDPSNTTVLTNQSDDESDKGSDSSAEESSEEEESDEETDDNDDVEQSDTANDKLRLAIQQAFGDQNIETDAESIDIDDMSDTGSKLMQKLYYFEAQTEHFINLKTCSTIFRNYSITTFLHRILLGQIKGVVLVTLTNWYLIRKFILAKINRWLIGNQQLLIVT